MSISVTPLHPHLGAEVRGVDLRRPVAPDVFAEIEAAFNTHAVLVFPDQPLTDDQQTAFSLLFGPLEVAMSYAGENKRLRTNTVTDISNLDDDGNVLSLQDRRRLFNL